MHKNWDFYLEGVTVKRRRLIYSKKTLGWDFSGNGVLRYIFIMCSLFCSATKDPFGLLQHFHFLKNAGK